MKLLQKFLPVASMALAMLLSVGCKKDSNIETLRVRIVPYNSSGKVYVDGGSPHWNDGDLIRVNDVVCTLSVSAGSANGSLEVPSSNMYVAVYPASIVDQLGGTSVSLVLPKLQPYTTDASGHQVVNAPMAAYLSAESQSSTLQFRNLGALLAIQITNGMTDRPSLVLDSITVLSASQSVALCGEATIVDLAGTAPYCSITSSASTHNALQLAAVDEEGSPTSMNLSVSNDGQHPTVVYVYVPAIVATDVNNRFTIRLCAHEGSNIYKYEQTQANAYSGNIGRNQMASVPFATSANNETAETNAPQGTVPGGVFTINSNGDQVYFSQGNLQYKNDGDGTTHSVNNVNNRSTSDSSGVWRFAPQQWYTCGSNNTHLSATANSGWIDIFCWGASGYFGSNPYHYYGNALQPVASTYGNWTLGNFDWGAYNAISNGGDEPGLWRTLTSTEWSYLMGTGTTSNQRRYVNGGTGKGYCFNRVNYQRADSTFLGILIYPDGYTQQLGTGDTYTITEIPSECVFLPAAGSRTIPQNVSGTCSYQGFNEKGYYWASDSGSGYRANSFFFSSEQARVMSSTTVAGCVRLVCPVSPISK